MPQILLYSFFRIWNPCPLHLNLGNLCNLFGQQNTEKVNCANFWVQTLKYWYYPLFVSWKILPWNSKLSCKNSNYLAKLLCGKFIMSMRRVRKRGLASNHSYHGTKPVKNHFWLSKPGVSNPQGYRQVPVPGLLGTILNSRR